MLPFKDIWINILNADILWQFLGSGLLLAAISHIVTQGDFKRFKNPRAFAAYTVFVPEHSGMVAKTE